jgi:hypothetical protein
MESHAFKNAQSIIDIPSKQGVRVTIPILEQSICWLHMAANSILLTSL